jgi:hypothetical protein
VAVRVGGIYAVGPSTQAAEAACKELRAVNRLAGAVEAGRVGAGGSGK